MGNAQGKAVVFTDQGILTVVRKEGWNELTRAFLSVNLDHFKLLRVVGKGAFGKVRIVERKDTGLTFALKYIRKDEGSQVAFCHLDEILTDCKLVVR